MLGGNATRLSLGMEDVSVENGITWGVWGRLLGARRCPLSPHVTVRALYMKMTGQWLWPANSVLNGKSPCDG